MANRWIGALKKVSVGSCRGKEEAENRALRSCRGKGEVEDCLWKFGGLVL